MASRFTSFLFAFFPLLCVIAYRALAFYMPIMGIILCALYWHDYRALPRLQRSWFFVVLSIVVWAAASILWASNRTESLNHVLNLIPLGIGAVLWASTLSSLRDKGQTLNSSWIIAGYAIACLLLVFDIQSNFALYRLLHGLTFSDHARVDFLNRQILTMMFLTPAVLAMAWAQYGVKRTLMLCLPIIILFAQTNSQASQLSFMLGGIFAVLPFLHGRKIRFFMAGLTVGLTLVAPFVVEKAYDRLATTLHESPFFGETHGYAADRLEIWGGVAKQIRQRPILGHGIEAGRDLPLPIQNTYYKGKTVLHPHNYALQFWLEGGLVAALLGGVLVAWLIIQSSGIALITVMMFLVGQAVAYGLWQSWWIADIFMVAMLLPFVPRLSFYGQNQDFSEINTLQS